MSFSFGITRCETVAVCKEGCLYPEIKTPGAGIVIVRQNGIHFGLDSLQELLHMNSKLMRTEEEEEDQVKLSKIIT